MSDDVERPEWMERFMGELTEWVLNTPGGGVKFVRARSQEEALRKAVSFEEVEVSGTHDVRPRVGRSDARLMPEREFLQRLRELVER